MSKDQPLPYTHVQRDKDTSSPVTCAALSRARHLPSPRPPPTTAPHAPALSLVTTLFLSCCTWRSCFPSLLKDACFWRLWAGRAKLVLSGERASNSRHRREQPQPQTRAAAAGSEMRLNPGSGDRDSSPRGREGLGVFYVPPRSFKRN